MFADEMDRLEAEVMRLEETIVPFELRPTGENEAGDE